MKGLHEDTSAFTLITKPMTSRPEKTVLVVEDDALIRESLAELLELEDYRVSQASNGQEALDWLQTHEEPKLIVLDLMMPVMSGWELLDRLRDDDRLSHVPVVVTSATVEQTPTSVAEVLEKPFEVDQLLDAVRHYAA